MIFLLRNPVLTATFLTIIALALTLFLLLFSLVFDRWEWSNTSLSLRSMRYRYGSGFIRAVVSDRSWMVVRVCLVLIGLILIEAVVLSFVGVH